MTLTPAYPTPAIPMPLSVPAATTPAIQVPWPFASVSPFDPSSTDVPGTTLADRSGWEASIPVSSTATFAEPKGATFPYA